MISVLDAMAKICEDEVVVLIYEDIFNFKISMAVTISMKVLQRLQKLLEVISSDFLFKLAFLHKIKKVTVSLVFKNQNVVIAFSWQRFSVLRASHLRIAEEKSCVFDDFGALKQVFVIF